MDILTPELWMAIGKVVKVIGVLVILVILIVPFLHTIG
jgi:hypothetical protein